MAKPLRSRMLDRMHGVDSITRQDPRVKPFVKQAIRLGQGRVSDPRGLLRDLVKGRNLPERIASAIASGKPLRGPMHALVIRHPQAVVEAYAAVLEHDFRIKNGVPLSQVTSSKDASLSKAAISTMKDIAAIQGTTRQAVQDYVKAFTEGGFSPVPYSLIEALRPELHLPEGKGGFSPADKHRVQELCDAANRHGVDAAELLGHFSIIPPELLLNLDMDPAQRVHPGLDVLLFREPDAVFPGFLPYAHKTLQDAEKNKPGLLEQHGVTDVRKKAEEITEKARLATLNYYARHEFPEGQARGGEAIQPPLLRRLWFWSKGLPMNFARNPLINNFLQMLKEKYHRPNLADRQGILMELRPRPGHPLAPLRFLGVRPFGSLISKENLENSVDPELIYEPEDRYGSYVDRVNPDAYGFDLHNLMLHDPSVVKLAHRTLYPTYMKRRWEYRLAGLVDRFSKSRWKMQETRDAQIEAACKQVDDNVEWYKTHFTEARSIRMAKSVAGR